MNKVYRKVMFFLGTLLIMVYCTACGEQKLSFGKEVFFGVKAAEEMNFTKGEEHPVQIAVGNSHVWTLTANSRDCVYEREIDTGAMRNPEWQQGEQELVMGISAVDDTLYTSVSCRETVQVRKFIDDGQWATIISIPWEEAPEQMQPTLTVLPQASPPISWVVYGWRKRGLYILWSRLPIQEGYGRNWLRKADRRETGLCWSTARCTSAKP